MLQRNNTAVQRSLEELGCIHILLIRVDSKILEMAEVKDIAIVKELKSTGVIGNGLKRKGLRKVLILREV